VSYEPSIEGPEDAPPAAYGLAEVQREVAAMSRFLVEEAGVRRGDRVAIYKTNDQRCFRWFLATIRAGGVAVPLNPLLRLPELQSIVARCEAGTVVTDQALFEGVIGSREALPGSRWVQGGDEPALEGFSRFTSDWMEAPALAPAGITPSDTVALFHTSGTEGTPKGAMLASETMLAGSAIALFAAPLVGRQALALFTLPSRPSRGTRSRRWWACRPCSYACSAKRRRGNLWPACGCGCRPAIICPRSGDGACCSMERC
jgi:acyl-CoA synthetase (AMP-forming)/AMP-acid ligase II